MSKTTHPDATGAPSRTGIAAGHIAGTEAGATSTEASAITTQTGASTQAGAINTQAGAPSTEAGAITTQAGAISTKAGRTSDVRAAVRERRQGAGGPRKVHTT